MSAEAPGAKAGSRADALAVLDDRVRHQLAAWAPRALVVVHELEVAFLHVEDRDIRTSACWRDAMIPGLQQLKFPIPRPAVDPEIGVERKDSWLAVDFC